MATISVSCHCDKSDCEVCKNGHMAITDKNGTRYPFSIIKKKEPNRIWVLSTSNKWHILDTDGRYVCNKAVGVIPLSERITIKDSAMYKRMKWARCKNCIIMRIL